jgi:membrane-bound lytic murein transglycosylase A
LIGRRDENGKIVPYHDRGAIDAGALDGQKLEICWLKDPFGRFRFRSRARRA